MTVLPGVLAYSGLGLRGVLLLRRPAPLRRLGPPAPHRMALIRALAGGRARRAGGSGSWGPSNGKFVLQTQRSPPPSPAPPHSPPPAPGTSPGFAAPPGPPRAARPKVRDSPLPRRVSRTWGPSSVCGGRRVAFPGEKALLGVGPGVQHVQTCCWGAAHLILEVAGTGGWWWKGADISDQSHLATESGPGCRWR